MLPNLSSEKSCICVIFLVTWSKCLLAVFLFQRTESECVIQQIIVQETSVSHPFASLCDGKYKNVHYFLILLEKNTELLSNFVSSGKLSSFVMCHYCRWMLFSSEKQVATRYLMETACTLFSFQWPPVNDENNQHPPSHKVWAISRCLEPFDLHLSMFTWTVLQVLLQLTGLKVVYMHLNIPCAVIPAYMNKKKRFLKYKYYHGNWI